LLCLTKTLLLLVQSLYLRKFSVKQERNKGGDGSKEQCLEGDTAKVKYKFAAGGPRQFAEPYQNVHY
jgi:hypothetical protein